MARLGKNGKVTVLRINEKGGIYGPTQGGLEAEVIFQLDSTGDTKYGFKLRDGAEGGAQRGMFLLLKEAHLRSLNAWIAYEEHAHAHRCYRVTLGGEL